MKLKLMLMIILSLAFSPTYAWNKVNDLYVIYGTRITKTDMLSPYAEIVYSPSYDSFGISFVDSDGKKEHIKYGIFNMRTCGIDTTGAIVENSILSRSGTVDQIQNIFLECNRPMFFRIWNTNNEYVTYKFENVGTLTKE